MTGGQTHIREILGGNMKTHVAVYEEGLFDLRGAKLFNGGNAPSRPPKETLKVLSAELTTQIGRMSVIISCVLEVFGWAEVNPPHSSAGSCMLEYVVKY